MNIGIIVHSKTGTTLAFGELIAQALRDKGHNADIVRVETDNSSPAGGSEEFTITSDCDCSKFDAVIVGSPVWAFSPSPIIMACIQQLQNISGKKVLPIATMGFPFTWMGGTRTIKMISRAVENKGASVLPGRVIPKLFHNYQKLMEQAAAEISDYFGGSAR